jgi:endonuclease III
VELLEDYLFSPHLVHPLRCKAIASARLKNDKVDAAILAQLLRAGLLPEAWIAPPTVGQLRALLTALPGVGEFTALIVLAEIGDITRFPAPASWRPGPG